MSDTTKIGTAELLFRCAERMGLEPVWLTANGVFAVATDAGERYVNFATSPLNNQVAASLAKDKYLTRLVLGRHDMPNIPFARPKTHEQAADFLHEHRRIIAKPVRGSGARDIHIISSEAQLRRLNIRQYIIEQYIPGQEMRYLVLGDRVIAVHRSDYGVSVAATRPLKRISYETADWDAQLVDQSVRICRALGLKFAAVDYMIDAVGKIYLLEVNTRPGFKWFHAPTVGPKVDLARLFLEAMLEQQAVTTLHIAQSETAA